MLEDVRGDVGSLLEAMGIPSGQGLEALGILQGMQEKERQKAQGLDALDPGAALPEAAEPSDAEVMEQRQQQNQLERALAGRICSERRAHVLRRFLAMLAREREDEAAVPLAIQAKQAAREAVAGSALRPPPPEMEMSLTLDAVYAGGDSVWVSVDTAVAKAPDEGIDAGAPSQRAPADLLVVVDVSGSMTRTLPFVRKCLAGLTALVEPQDCLALVKFDDRASIVMPWRDMDEEGLAAFVKAQEELLACGGTNFLPVLKMCFDELLLDETPGRARSMLFISDGAPCESDSDVLHALCSKLRSANISIVAAGFGEHINAGLMSAIAQTGCGPFVYVPEPAHIPEQLGRIWASVAHTSVSSAFAVVRPLGGARVAAVEGAFGAAELSLRPDGRPSSQQVLILQLGPVRRGASREVALQLKLPPHLSDARGKVGRADLRQPLLEVSVLSQAVAEDSPVFLQRADFCAMQVPSLLMETLLPFPVRFVLDNDFQEFDSQAFLRRAAETLELQQHELELTRLMRGSVIVDVHLKTEPARASQMLEEISAPEFKQRVGKAMEKAGYKLKSMTVPGQQVFRRLLQTRLAGALGSAAKLSGGDCIEIRRVQSLAGSDLAACLDPPGPASMASKVSHDCELVLARVRSGGSRKHLAHDLVQQQAAHVAQYKCHSVSESLERYEQPEAEKAAGVMARVCGELTPVGAFWETLSESVEILVHGSTDGQVGVMVWLAPKRGRELDFGDLMNEVCPVFEVTVNSEEAALAGARTAYAYPVSAHAMRPVVHRSCHPYRGGSSTEGCVRVPGAQRLKVRVDPRSCSRDGSLTFCADAQRNRPLKTLSRTLGKTTGRPAADDFWELCYEGSELWFSFRSGADPSCSLEWGYDFEVEASMPESSREGLLLHAGFVGLSPGPCRVAARSMPHTWQIRARDVHVREFELAADARKSLVPGESASQALGFASPVRLLAANGRPARSSALDELLSAHEGMASPSGEVLQLAFTSDASLQGLQAKALEKARLVVVGERPLKSVAGALEVELPAPPRPELTSWSWDGACLQLCWRDGWPVGTCVLRAFDAAAESLEQARLFPSFGMASPEAAHRPAQPGQRGVRTASFAIPAHERMSLKLELQLRPPASCPRGDEASNCLTAWLVPQDCQVDLEVLAAAEGGGGRHFWQGPLATLVTDGAL